jgi:arabinosaccharide transport system substrate-binding protein
MLVQRGAAGPGRKPDLVFATFTKEHAMAYRPAIAQFEKDHDCTIQLQVVNDRALTSRLQSALQVGADVPDMVELQDGWMGIFTKGPIEDVGFVDLTTIVREFNLDGKPLFDQLVSTRFGKWSSRGHIFALPHDVHPTMLAYRRDLVEKLGIDVSRLTTWDEFCRVGREVVRNSTDPGTGVVKHYMIDLPASGPWALRLLLLQHGGGMFTTGTGDVMFDDEHAVDVACWYARQTSGPDQIAFACEWGQTLAKAMSDGLCLFYICPDWRTAQFEQDVPGLAGKMALMPMPAWTNGGPRTSTWGATGLAFTKQCQRAGKFDLAWKLAMYLYYDTQQLGPRFAATNILPPYKPSWAQPAFAAPRAYWGGAKVGELYVSLAAEVPYAEDNAYMQQAEGKLWEAYGNIADHFGTHGENGLREFARMELTRCGDHVRKLIARNVFLSASPSPRTRGEERGEGPG